MPRSAFLDVCPRRRGWKYVALIAIALAAIVRPSLGACPSFAAPLHYAADYDRNPHFMEVGDFNNDGKSDLLYVKNWFVNQFQGTKRYVSVRLGNGDGTFALPTGFEVFYPVTGIAAADFNRDGNLDVLVVVSVPDPYGNTSGNIVLYLGNGSGFFSSSGFGWNENSGYVDTLPLA